MLKISKLPSLPQTPALSLPEIIAVFELSLRQADGKSQTLSLKPLRIPKNKSNLRSPQNFL